MLASIESRSLLEIKGALLLVLTLLPGVSARADSPPPGRDPRVIFRDARIVTITSSGDLSVLPRGDLLVRGGRIEAVGEALPAPKGSRTVNVAGQWILPGFLDAHYLPGILTGENNEFTRAVTEDFMALDAFDPWDGELRRVLARGVTALAVSPGRRNVVGGRISVVKAVPGRFPPKSQEPCRVYKAAIGLQALGGPGLPRYPTSISGALDVLESWVRAGEPGARSSGIPAGIHPDSASGVREFSVSGSSGWPEALERVLVRVENRTQLEQVLQMFEGTARVPVLAGAEGIEPGVWSRLERLPPAVVMGPFGFSAPVRALRVPAVLKARGVPIALASDGSRRDILTSAALAMRHGFSFEEALAALTVTPARIFGLERRLGRLEPGLDADLVIWSGNPFSLNARVKGVWVEGEAVRLDLISGETELKETPP